MSSEPGLPIGPVKRGKHGWAWFAVAAAVVVLDQATKALVQAHFRHLPPGETIPLLGRLLRLNLVQNAGVAFGLKLGATWQLVLLVLVLGLFFVWSLRVSSQGPLALLLGGAAGNLIDRVRFGYVVDFLDLRVWPVFNLADVAITTAAIWLALSLWRKGKDEGSRTVQSRELKI